MAFRLRSVKLPLNSVSLEEARSRVYDLFRSSRRSIHAATMDVHNLHDVVSKSQLRSTVAAEIRKNSHLTESKLATVLRSDITRLPSVDSNQKTKEVLGAFGVSVLFRRQYTREYIVSCWSPLHLLEKHGANTITHYSARSFASRASKKPTETSSESKKEVSTVEDPFDDITYNIPQKPVTFAEGASYSLIILAGLGVASAAAYAVFKELIFEPKEYKIFNKALKRIQDDGQVRVRIGSPITGYGQESRNRAARQRIPNRVFTDEFGIEHVEINFYIRGPHGAGKVFTEMFKDQEDKQWKFTYLIVEINSPSKAQLMLESYIPSAASALA
ncbi:hypothetical protein LWI28_023042 [Acer negundo]|uniref:Mitochondrial import inner membrane translocase subunit Tim21 n=1 Tax=Acer negundo TaxID=4023 RepID=A0AAD5JG57_ACENE|nr:hypothetical protein LWI28_023042 [Acer negundo]KAK4838077.1 hypothetical protein QYF36_010782 [Acer negundo]